jgi:cell division protein ZapA
MSNVTLNIGGRDYAVACAEGEEAHVRGLGALIDGKIRAMGSAAGHSETRDLLFATLLLADEIHELKRGGAASPTPAAAQADPAIDALMADKLEALATRLESCADGLEG